MHYALNRMRQRSAIFWYFLLIKKTLRPNSIVEIIIKVTGFFFLRKFQKRSIYTEQKQQKSSVRPIR